MYDFFDFVSLLFGAITTLFLVATIMLIINFKISTGLYQYIDLDGNTGYAKICLIHDGQLTCETEDKTIQVKEFTRLD